LFPKNSHLDLAFNQAAEKKKKKSTPTCSTKTCSTKSGPVFFSRNKNWREVSCLRNENFLVQGKQTLAVFISPPAADPRRCEPYPDLLDPDLLDQVRFKVFWGNPLDRSRLVAGEAEKRFHSRKTPRPQL